MPYRDLPPEAFWGACRKDQDFLVEHLYTAKFGIAGSDGISTAGSCFAQNIGRFLRKSGARYLDVEPAPGKMRDETAARFGYGLFSARYGNIYTAAQLRQLIEDAREDRIHMEGLWETEGRWYDALRPSCEPGGLQSAEEVIAQRRDHLRRVRDLLSQTDVFILTLGLTEYWQHRSSGLAFPSCPGVVAGRFDPAEHSFVNAGIEAVRNDLLGAIQLLREFNGSMRVLLTVSPIPLTATMSGQHVLVASTWSKAVLRAVAGEVAAGDADVDYFPSYEIIVGSPWGAKFYADNLRQVTNAGVDYVMSRFFGAHTSLVETTVKPDEDLEATVDDVCEEALLEAMRR